MTNTYLFLAFYISNPPANLNPEQGALDDSEQAPVTPVLPTLPSQDLELDLSAILGPTLEEYVFWPTFFFVSSRLYILIVFLLALDRGTEKVKKRQSNVLKLSEENEKLKAQLKAMTDRLEAAERKREELAGRRYN